MILLPRVIHDMARGTSRNQGLPEARLIAMDVQLFGRDREEIATAVAPYAGDVVAALTADPDAA